MVGLFDCDVDKCDNSVCCLIARIESGIHHSLYTTCFFQVLGDKAGVELLLNVNDTQIDLRINDETALTTAGQYCHADVVGALLDHGSSVTGETCKEVPLVALLSKEKLQKCNGSQLQEVLQEFKRYNATLNATFNGTSTDCRGPALTSSKHDEMRKMLHCMLFALTCAWRSHGVVTANGHSS